MKNKKRGTRGERVVARIHKRLQEEIARSSRTMKAVNDLVDKGEGWLKGRRHASRLELGHLLDILAFINRRLGRLLRHALPDPERILDPPTGEEPELLKKVRIRLDRGGRPAGRPFGPGYVRSLDHQRYEDPVAAMKEVERSLERIDVERIPRLLGVLGSTWRLLGDLDAAEHAIYLAWEHAGRSGDRALAAELLQRMAYVLAAQGHLSEALWVSERAQLEFADLGELAGMGKTLVDKGLWLNYLGRYREAISALEGSLHYLPEEERRNRSAALHNLALSHKAEGRLRKALEQLQRVKDLEIDPCDVAKVCWLEGRLCKQLGWTSLAEEYLAEAVEKLKAVDAVDACLASVDLVELYLLCDRHSKALDAARSMKSLVELLGTNQAAIGAIAELLKIGRHNLRISLVRRVRAQLRDVRNEIAMSRERLR